MGFYTGFNFTSPKNVVEKNAMSDVYSKHEALCK